MTWSDYCAGVTLLTKHFGAYTKQEIDAGFNYWRAKHYAALLQEIDIAFQTNKRFKLNEPLNYKKPPYFVHFKDEPRKISDNHLDKILKENDAQSLLDLIFKQKKERP